MNSEACQKHVDVDIGKLLRLVRLGAEVRTSCLQSWTFVFHDENSAMFHKPTKSSLGRSYSQLLLSAQEDPEGPGFYQAAGLKRILSRYSLAR